MELLRLNPALESFSRAEFLRCGPHERPSGSTAQVLRRYGDYGGFATLPMLRKPDFLKGGTLSLNFGRLRCG